MLISPDLSTEVTSYLEVEAHYSIGTIDYQSDVEPVDGGIAPTTMQNVSLPTYGLAFDPTNYNTFNWSASFNVYDSIGTQRALTAYFIKRAEGEWAVKYDLDGDVNNVTVLPGPEREHYLYFKCIRKIG